MPNSSSKGLRRAGSWHAPLNLTPHAAQIGSRSDGYPPSPEWWRIPAPRMRIAGRGRHRRSGDQDIRKPATCPSSPQIPPVTDHRRIYGELRAREEAPTRTPLPLNTPKYPAYIRHPYIRDSPKPSKSGTPPQTAASPQPQHPPFGTSPKPSLLPNPPFPPPHRSFRAGGKARRSSGYRTGEMLARSFEIVT